MFVTWTDCPCVCVLAYGRAGKRKRCVPILRPTITHWTELKASGSSSRSQPSNLHSPLDTEMNFVQLTLEAQHLQHLHKARHEETWATMNSKPRSHLPDELWLMVFPHVYNSAHSYDLSQLWALRRVSSLFNEQIEYIFLNHFLPKIYLYIQLRYPAIHDREQTRPSTWPRPPPPWDTGPYFPLRCHDARAYRYVRFYALRCLDGKGNEGYECLGNRGTKFINVLDINCSIKSRPTGKVEVRIPGQVMKTIRWSRNWIPPLNEGASWCEVDWRVLMNRYCKGVPESK
ncbi:hypothetical protein BDV96DRAFT_77190 [Lophiotrema nucula]|uniref:F-box domain-containing protein n=1 Tax=Lophiotrema nucula TaxID=690887 RepID=A0A6A5ZAF4_9PLEO|nr:hypothetical protein BDV96DRAFT_77190 [Lophiotrema nucula]